MIRAVTSMRVLKIYLDCFPIYLLQLSDVCHSLLFSFLFIFSSLYPLTIPYAGIYSRNSLTFANPRLLDCIFLHLLSINAVGILFRFIIMDIYDSICISLFAYLSCQIGVEVAQAGLLRPMAYRAGNFQPGPPGSTQPALKNAGRAKEIGTRLYWVGSGCWPAYIGLSRASPSGCGAGPLTFFFLKRNYLLFLLELIFLLSFFHVFFLFIFNFNVFRLFFMCVRFQIFVLECVTWIYEFKYILNIWGRKYRRDHRYMLLCMRFPTWDIKKMQKILLTL